MKYPKIAKRLLEWNSRGTGKQGRPKETWIYKINEYAIELDTTLDRLSTRAKSRLERKQLATLLVLNNSK